MKCVLKGGGKMTAARWDKGKGNTAGCEGVKEEAKRGKVTMTRET